MANRRSLSSLHLLPTSQRHYPSPQQKRSTTTPHLAMAAYPPSTPQRRSSQSQRRRSLQWPTEVPPMTPTKSISPKEYLTALSTLISFCTNLMSKINLPALIWAFNHAHARNDRGVMRRLGMSMFGTLAAVHDAYHTFCETRGTFDEEEIWKMVLGLGDEGEGFWDVVEELGDLIEIVEGEETGGFWECLEDVVRGSE